MAIVNNYFVILCGGSGTRLWPLSRKNRPKQLLPFLNNSSLLEQTIDRLTPLAPIKENLWLMTTQEQEPLIMHAVEHKVGFLLQEPLSRNTGPAILYSCLEIEKQNPNAIAVFLPTDHFIPETTKFCSYLQKAIAYAEVNNTIVTLGLMPTSPATEYGYIQAQATSIEAGTAYPVEKFHEKPLLSIAQTYFKQPNMFWNLGIFIGKVSVFINEYKTCAPEMFTTVSNFYSNKTSYNLVPSQSIDYAVMEKSNNISVIPCDFAWSDVGNLNIFLTLNKQKPIHEIINIDATNNIAKTNKKLIAFIGVDDLCVIEDDDVIVVAKRTDIEKVKEVHKILHQKARTDLL
jgi:Mannose-1-phosphate guanylyltransferase